MQNHIFYSSSFNNMSESGMLKFEGAGIAGLSESLPIYKELSDWQRIVVQFDIKEITGTVTFKGVTSVSIVDNLFSTSPGAFKQDGATPFNSPDITKAGQYVVAIARNGSANTVSNIGALLGFHAVLSSSNVSGKVTVIVTK